MDTRTPSPSRVAFRICCVEGEDDLRKWRIIICNEYVQFIVRCKVNECHNELPPMSFLQWYPECALQICESVSMNCECELLLMDCECESVLMNYESESI